MHWKVAFSVALLAAPVAEALWPLPTSYTNGSNTLSLSPHFNIQLPNGAPADVHLAAERTLDDIQSSKHEYLSVGRGTEWLIGRWDQDIIKTLNLQYESAGPWSSIVQDAAKAVEERVESYHLTIAKNGTATLTSSTSIGLLRGLTTFQQLLYRLPSHSKRHIRTAHEAMRDQSLFALPDDDLDELILPFAPWDIQDGAAFAWRSVMLDTARNWFPVTQIEKLLDTMCFVKLNVFHWHIVDSQSFPAIFASHPELSSTAYTQDQTYSSSTISHIIQYAAERGIDVVLELDMPGHTAAIGQVYPELVACFHAFPWYDFAVEPPAGQLRFILPKAVSLVRDLLGDALGLVKSSYFSTGGDEINAACYDHDQPTQAALRTTGQSINEALATFTGITQGILQSAGKTAVLWQEMILEHPENNLSKDTIAQIWVSSADAKAVVEKGYRIIHAASDYFYLDCGRGNWIDQPAGGDSWCDPFKSWGRMYSFDPFANLTTAERSFVVGGQASLWTEQTDQSNMETVMWPRAAALAEVFWTGSAHAAFPLNADDAVFRFNDLRYRLVDRGVSAAQTQPHWCVVRPGECKGSYT